MVINLRTLRTINITFLPMLASLAFITWVLVGGPAAQGGLLVVVWAVYTAVGVVMLTHLSRAVSRLAFRCAYVFPLALMNFILGGALYAPDKFGNGCGLPEFSTAMLYSTVLMVAHTTMNHVEITRALNRHTDT